MYLDEDASTIIHELNLQLNDNEFYIKRDDLFPLSFGGNKARKAILFFKDVEKKGADCIVTYGSSSSNHCRIIANIAAAKRMPCYIISPSENSHSTANSKMIEIFNAVVVKCPIDKVSSTIERQFSELEAKGLKPYFIQGGGHGDIGTEAYVNVYKEILAYEKFSDRYFDYIIHASGTGTTQAGLVCGKVLNNDKREIIGISIARNETYGGKIVLDSVNSYLYRLKKRSVSRDEITFIDKYVLDGYSIYNEEIINTIRDTIKLDGIPLDSTYTGKAFWGMKEFIKEQNINGKKILFIHTGGTPLYFDGLEELKNE